MDAVCLPTYTMEGHKDRHVLIVDDREGLLSVPSSRPEAARLIVSLPHPKTGLVRKYLVMGGNLCEIQRVSPQLPCSWFVDQSVVSGESITSNCLDVHVSTRTPPSCVQRALSCVRPSATPNMKPSADEPNSSSTASADGSVLVASRIDPLFILLPLLAVHDKHFSPLSQYLAHTVAATAGTTPYSPAVVGFGSPAGSLYSNSHVLSGLRGLADALRPVCDINTSLGEGPEDILYRLNRERTLEHLAGRVKRLSAVLQSKASATRSIMKAQFGSFSVSSAKVGAGATSSASTSTSSTSSSSGAAPSVEAVHVEHALGILSEYLADEWVVQLCQKLSVNPEIVLPHVKGLAASFSSSTPSAGTGTGTGTACTTEAEATAAGATAASNKDAMWNARALDDDAAMLVNRFLRPDKSSGTSGEGGASVLGKRPTALSPLTLAQKKLAATNTKGMKAMSSFFGAAKP